MDLIWDQLFIQRRHHKDIDPDMNELFQEIDHVYMHNYNLQFGFGKLNISCYCCFRYGAIKRFKRKGT